MTHATQVRPIDRDKDMIPAPLLRMMLALVLASLALTCFSVWTGQPHGGVPKDSPVIQSRSLIIKTGGAKAVSLYAMDGTLLSHLDHGGFVTVIGSGLDRVRAVHKVADDTPVILARHANGRLTVDDPVTGWSVELRNFGSDNEAAFAALLPSQ